MTSIEQEDKDKLNGEKSKYDDKENDSKDLKSKTRDKDESKRSKKHKKKRSHSSGSSDSSPSRSRSKSNKKSHRKHKSKRSRSRSPKKSKYSRSRRSRSRSPRKHRSRRSRSRSNRRDNSRRDDRKKETKDTRDIRDTRDTRDKGRKGFKFDSPPKEMQLTEDSIDSLDLSAFGIPNVSVLKEMYPALKTMDPSELLQKLQLVRDMSNLRTSKVDRKLYIGNIPTGLTPQMLMDLLNSALQKMNINVETPGNSIIGAWISPDNNYAFVDFRTPEEATAGFGLNSVAIHGQTLKVGRPRSYQQDEDNNTNPLAALLGLSGLPMNPLAGLGQGEGTMTTNLKIQTQSRVIVLKNMVNIPELEIDEEYNEILEDVKDECEKFGKVVSIKIPRPKDVAGNAPELGKIFVEFANVEEAKTARKELQGTTFDERTVEVSFYDEQKYAQNELSEL